MRLPTRALLLDLLITVPLSPLVGAHSIAPGSRNEVSRGSVAKTYSLQDWYQNDDFFSHVSFGLYPVTRDLTLSRNWTFFTGNDPTNGNVNYLSMQDATSQGLAYVNWTDNTFVMAIDATSSILPGGKRNS